MYAEERRTQLVQLARSEGRVQVSLAAERFDVTPETIRRDLEVLDRQGVLRRVHGGAMPTEFLPLGDLALPEREGAAAEQKERIAQAALALLPNGSGSSVLVDAGTTTGRLAALLPVDIHAQFFTNSLPIAATLSTRTQAGVHLLGGTVRGVTQACVGAPVVAALAHLRVDVAFLGTNGLSAQHGLSTPDVDEAQVKQQMVASARRTVLLCDSSKFGVETTTSFAGLDDVDVLVTDSITPAQRALVEGAGIEVVIA